MVDDGDEEDEREPCRYGAKCYSKDEKHRNRFSHPKKKLKVKVDEEPAQDTDRSQCKFGLRCYQKNPKHYEEFYHPGDVEDPQPEGQQHWSIATKLPIDETPMYELAEPPPLNLMMQTTHIFNAKPTAPRHYRDSDEGGEQLEEHELVLGVYSHSTAIEQECCPPINKMCCGQICKTRTELMNSLKISTKRVEIASDEASGCCPSVDEEAGLRIGHWICGLCCCCPHGLQQTKALSSVDLSGYTREESIPKIVYLAALRFALIMYVLFVVVSAVVIACSDSEAFKDAVTDALADFNVTGSAATGAWQPTSQQSTEVLVTAMLGLIGFLALFYIMVDRAFTWGWRFVMSTLLISVPVVGYLVYTFEDFLATLDMNIIREEMSVFEDMYAMAVIVSWAVATLPFWLLLSWLYVAFYGCRLHQLTLHFSNKISYTMTLLPEQIDDAILKLSQTMSQGVTKFEDSFPVTMPGGNGLDVDFACGGGAVRVTSWALGLDRERYAFWWCGPTLSRRTEVQMHSRMTKLVKSHNFLPMFWRKFLVVVGLVMLIGGGFQLAAAKLRGDAIWRHEHPTGAPPTYTYGDLNHPPPPPPPTDYGEMAFMLEFQLALGLFIFLLPCILQCLISVMECHQGISATYNWGSTNVSFRVGTMDADTFEEYIVNRVGAMNGGHPGEIEGEETAAYTTMNSCQLLRCFDCFGHFFGWIRDMQITDKRIKISEDNGSTIISYWKNSVTEADIGPVSWCGCCSVCPCDGFGLPQENDAVTLSLNFGWQKAATAATALPGTMLAPSETFLFQQSEAAELMTELDAIIGNFVHDDWYPVNSHEALHR